MSRYLEETNNLAIKVMGRRLVEEIDVDAVIKELVDTSWSASDEEQGKAMELLKGLAYSDDPKAKKFMKDLDKATSAMKADVAESRSYKKKVLKEDSVSSLKPGDIFDASSGWKGGAHGVVVAKDRHGDGDFYWSLVKDGRLVDRGGNSHQVFSSNMLDDDVEKLGTMRLQKKSYKGLDWYLTGLKAVDHQELPNLDNRMTVFEKFATKKLQGLYARRENANYHGKNAELVNAFAEFMAGGGKPEAFDHKLGLDQQ